MYEARYRDLMKQKGIHRRVDFSKLRDELRGSNSL
jgi:hypothetical protein